MNRVAESAGLRGPALRTVQTALAQIVARSQNRQARDGAPEVPAEVGDDVFPVVVTGARLYSEFEILLTRVL